MSKFYGTVQGNRGQATRTGVSGITTQCASWQGAIECEAWHNEEVHEDWVEVRFIYWQGAGDRRVIYRGPIGKYDVRYMIAEKL